MKNIFIILLGVALMLPAGAGLAKGGDKSFPGRGQGPAHSNAPSTQTQVKGRERAAEVGKGEKKGLSKEKTAKQRRPKKSKDAHTAEEGEENEE